MKGKKYSIEKIIQTLSEAKMTSVTAVWRKSNICTSTYYRWQDNYSGLSSNQAKEMAIPSDYIFTVTDSRVMIHGESSLSRHSLCNTFSL